MVTTFPAPTGTGGGTITNNYNQYSEVNTYADLPVASDNINKTYQVKTTTGIIYINRKLAGFYRSNGTSWLYLGDVDTYSLIDHNHNLADLAEKSYNSLTDKPTIPTVPTTISSFTNDLGYLTSVAWSIITGKPTIPTKTSDLTNDNGFIDNSYHDSTKQDTLVSGTNIKSINGSSILGSGNLTITGSNSFASGITLGNTAQAGTTVLDWYEEGSWTPTVVGSTTAGTGTYTYQYGRYTRVGNRVDIQGAVRITAHTGAGNMRIAGLPFTSSSSTGLESNNICAFETLTAIGTPYINVAANTAYGSMAVSPTAGGTTAYLALDTTMACSFHLTYFV